MKRNRSHAGRVVLEDGVFMIEDWLPYEFSFVANRVSSTLSEMYGQRYGFSVTGWRVVAALGTHPNISAKELAELIGMDQVSITRAVGKLSGSGMVLRRGDTGDRRRVNLQLSAKGKAAYEDVLPLAQRIEEVLVESLSEAQKKSLKGTMKLMVARATRFLSDEKDWIGLLAVPKHSRTRKG